MEGTGTFSKAKLLLTSNIESETLANELYKTITENSNGKTIVSTSVDTI